MGIAVALRDAAGISSPAIRRRGGAVALAAFAERLLSPAVAYVLVSYGPTRALLVGATLGAALAVRGAAQRSFAARTEADLYRRAVEDVLAGDVLQPSLLPDDEARVSLFEGLHRIARVLSETIPNLGANLVAALLFAITVAAYEPLRVVLVGAAALAVGGAWLFVSRRRVDAAQTRAWRAWEPVAEGVTEACEARLELVATGSDQDFLRRFSAATREWDVKARRAGHVAGLLGRLPIAVLAVAVGAAVIADARLEGASWSDAAVRAGLLASMTPAFLGIARCLQEIVSNEPRLQLARRVFEGHSVTGRAGNPPSPTPKFLEFKAVSFAYEKEGRSVLRDVSFVWRAGEILALAGPNGSGKSTCLLALLRLGHMTNGEILVDGVPLGEVDAVSWRRSVAFLPQRPYLSSRTTARDCLRFLDADTPEATMRRSIERVGLLRRLGSVATDPLDAKVGELSAGERQRLALARVLCRPASLVILDEPDANLDRDGARLVAELVVELARDRMVLVAAHSTEVLDQADRTVTLEAGTVRAAASEENADISRAAAVQS